MRKCIVPLLVVLLFSFSTKAASIFWIGASGNAWSVGTNWSGGVVPGVNDSVYFSTSVTVNVDISPTVALLWVATGDVIFSSTANRLITIGNNSAGRFVFLVDLSSSLTLGQGAAVSIQTYGAGVSNTATIGYDARLIFGAANSQWIIAPFAASPSNCITDVFNQGIVEVAANNTGAVFSGAGTNNLVFSSGSRLNWLRNGGNAPAADFQNGSVINVTGIINTNLLFSNAAFYNGSLIWNCTAQNISGASAILFPAANTAMDSIRVISTGTGTVRLFTDPLGYTIGHLEVQGGTLELSSPVGNYRVGTITGNLKITGGTVIGNATFATDGTSLNRYPMTLTVNGNFIMTAGTFDLTNRPPVLNPGGAFQMNVKGDVAQIGGLVTATSAFGSQNYIMLNGTVLQNLELTNFTGPASLVINNPAGVLLQNDLFISYVLQFFSGVLTTSAANLLTMGPTSLVFNASNASFVDGPVSKIGNSTFTFPIGKTNCGPSTTVNGYAALEIANFSGGGSPTDQFTAEYKRGSAYTLGAISNVFINHISRCDYWTLTRDVATTSTVNITLSWNDAINNCITTAPYIDKLSSLTVVHNNNTGGSTWDTYGVANVTSGTTTSGTVTWDNGSPQSTTFGAFAIGSLDIDNPLPITINYFTGIKQNNAHVLNWKLTCNSTSFAAIEMERSTDGRNYKNIYSMHATALRCQQPFDHSDANPVAGVNYYRLKITDDHGKISYSSIVSLLNAAKGFDIVNIAPNPVVGSSFDLKISAAQAAQMEIIITDMQGRVLQKKAVNMIAGFNTIPMNVKNLAAGTYQLFGNSEDGRTRALRFVIQ